MLKLKVVKAKLKSMAVVPSLSPSLFESFSLWKMCLHLYLEQKRGLMLATNYYLLVLIYFHQLSQEPCSKI